MGLYDRHYYRESQGGFGGGGGGMQLAIPSLTPVVKKLLIVNVGVFVLCLLTGGPLSNIYALFALDQKAVDGLQIWRLFTYQYLHSPGSFMHILFNMLGLYFLGPALERHFGGKKFFIFYTVCGTVGGILFLILQGAGVVAGFRLIGASGSILGVLAACAILFPQFMILFFFFPIPIRIAAVVLGLMFGFTILTGGPNAGGEACHLGGMAAGGLWVLLERRGVSMKFRSTKSPWQRKIEQKEWEEEQIDHILEKVHEHGLHSLSTREKNILRRASERRQ